LLETPKALPTKVLKTNGLTKVRDNTMDNQQPSFAKARKVQRLGG
jgi:hypothetical protein